MRFEATSVQFAALSQHSSLRFGHRQST